MTLTSYPISFNSFECKEYNSPFGSDSSIEGWFFVCARICAVGFIKVVVLPEPVVPIMSVCAGFENVMFNLFFTYSAFIGIPSKFVFFRSSYSICVKFLASSFSVWKWAVSSPDIMCLSLSELSISFFECFRQ